MQDKLEKLLNEIGLSKDNYHYFKSSIIEKVIVYDKNKMWEFLINLNETLPLNVYEELLKKIKEKFFHIENIKLTITSLNTNYQYIKDYYYKILNDLIVTNPMLIVLNDRDFIIEDSTIIISAYNKNEFTKLNKIKNDIETSLRTYGFSSVLIEVKQIEETSIKELLEQETTNDVKFVPSKEIEQPKENTKPKYRFKKDTTVVKIEDIKYPIDNITIEAKVFGNDVFDTKSGFKIFTLKLTNEIDSIYAKIITKDPDEAKLISKEIKVGSWYSFYGRVQDDAYSKELVFMTRYKDITPLEKKDEVIIDNELEKRVELHTHTLMSQMDGLVSAKSLIKRAKSWGHKAIAITDHNCLQSFPEAFKEAKDFKVLYGCELALVDDNIDICFRENDSILLDNTYVVFDFETTGFNAAGGDTIIEVGAVKICNGEIIDRFSKLINPHRPLPAKIIEITNITDSMLENCEDEETVIKDFVEWIKDLPMVAHNAKFDTSFLEMAYKKYNLGTYTNPVIDTLELSRVINTNMGRHNLTALVKKYNVPWDETAHHRADYDAEGTALVFHKMLKELHNRNVEKMSDLNKMVSVEELHTIGNSYHINILVKNQIGLKNLFKIVSHASTTYFHKNARILRSKLQELREGLLIGSGCANSEIFTLARSKTDEELAGLINFYDYVEIQPLEVYDYLVQTGDFETKYEIINQINKIVRLTEETGKIIVATGDVHHLDRKDKISREIIINQKVPGGGRHPLNKKSITNIPSCHFRTTKEMLEDFNFLGKEKAYEIVVTNTNKIADMIEIIEVIRNTNGIPFSPKMDNSAQIVTDMVYKKARELYGENIPELIQTRIEKELKGIINGGFDVIYLIAQKLVKKSNDDGYFVGSRGSVGSSLVATMMGITEVNPLPAHYICPKCYKTIFESDGKMLKLDYPSGYDLPDKMCECGTPFNKEGQDMPFETFLGFKADKVPDIDLNFSSEYQSKAHDYTKVLFGEEYVYRAGTVGTVADKTAFGFVKGYFEDKGLDMPRSVEIERLAMGCTGVKRTTGQHPGGIVVVPNYMDVYDFTPYQYPADDSKSKWYTTHFEYHCLEENLLKLDILGHDDPTMLKYLTDLSGMTVEQIPMDDKDVFSLFSSPHALGVTADKIMCETGTLGLPETGTKFVISLLTETKPQTFGELVKVSGLSHGTDVWANNAQELIRNNVIPFKEVIGCRDDIMVYLSNNGLDSADAFKIMETVRKGKQFKDPTAWEKWKSIMKEKNIPDWYIGSLEKIKYMFPKAHATAYSMMCCRVAWYKVHQPINYYSSYFSVRCFDFDIETMIKGYNSIKEKITELNNKGYDKSNKEDSILDVLLSALEMTARGFHFGNIDLYKSHNRMFVIDEDKKTLIPPFRSIDGLGDIAASSIYEEAKKQPFISVEDFAHRCKVSQTIIDKMRQMGVFNNMPETSQLSLF